MPKTATVLFLFRYIIRRNMPPEKQKEYCPFVLCTKGEHAGEMISTCGNSRWETEADAQASLDEFMPALRRKAKKLGLDLSTLQILGRSTITVQSDWSANL